MAPAPALAPQQVLQAADQLGIDHVKPSQTHLLAVARAYLELPLPGPWERSVDASGKPSYVDKRTKKTSAEHPQLDQFEHLLSRLTALPPNNHEVLTCMEFQHADGSTYMHDFRPDTPASAPASQPGEALQGGTAQEAASEAGLAAEAPEAQPGPSEHAADAPATASTVEQAADAPAEASPAEQVAEDTSPEVAPAPAEGAEATGAVSATATASQEDPAPAAPEQAETGAQTAAPPTPPPEEAVAEPSETPAFGSSPGTAPSAAHQLIPPIPNALLEAFGIINAPESRPEPMGETGVRPGVKRLRYFSWWYEDVESTDLTFRVNSNSVVGGGLQKRYVTLDYNLDSGTFSMASANEDQDLRIPNVPVLTAKGDVAQIWDLHVGAMLSALGKKLTLHKADLETASWNERHAARLRQIRTELLAELQKYKPRAHKTALVFERGDRAGGGGLCLRYTVEQLNALVDDLQQYRPSKAEQYRSRINIKC